MQIDHTHPCPADPARRIDRTANLFLLAFAFPPKPGLVHLQLSLPQVDATFACLPPDTPFLLALTRLAGDL
jgi:hypothetical protein